MIVCSTILFRVCVKRTVYILHVYMYIIHYTLRLGLTVLLICGLEVIFEQLTVTFKIRVLQ